MTGEHFSFEFGRVLSIHGDRGSTMVKVLCYKSEGSWCHWIFHWHKILPIAIWPSGRLSIQQKRLPGVFTRGKGGRCLRLTTSHHPVPLSRNLGTLTSWNPLGHSRSLTALIYVYLFYWLFLLVIPMALSFFTYPSEYWDSTSDYVKYAVAQLVEVVR